MSKRRVCIITGTRAEYGLLSNLMSEIKNDKDLELQIIATGMHLSPEFGLTYKQIEKDGFFVNEKVEILLSSDTGTGISKSIGLGLISFGECFSRLSPDIIVGLGDRFELLGAVISAMILKIPIAHIHGGESTEGLIDEAIRHSITKMSHLHFTATEGYRNRVIQLGENPATVFNFGALGIDNINSLRLLSKEQLENEIGFKFGKRNVIVTFHPVTLEKSTAEEQFGELLLALDQLDDIKIIFTKPNADTDGRIIINMIDDYVKINQENTISFFSMGQLRYLSALQFVDAMVGNSSSGIIEMPSFKKGTINIGDRQRGRIQADSVINCDPEKKSILSAFAELFSNQFQNKLLNVTNPYGNGGASVKIKQILKDAELVDIVKKKFYDIKFEL